MTLNLNDVATTLPDDLDERVSGSAEDTLRHLLADLSTKPAPVSRLARLWILGSVHAKIAAAYLVYWVRTSYATADEKERRLNETHLSAAIKLLGVMGYLRGAIMKAGQMLSAYPNVLPDQFVDTLSTLHFEAPPMHYSLLREFVRNELGADPETLFDEFETRAFAAASLGQVHRARLKTGELVAVKIQYPGIANTIAADCRNMLALFSPMRLSRDWDNIREQWDDIRRTLEAETDYVREAQYLERARAAFREDEGVKVPRTYPALCTPRVLTMQYFDGLHIEHYLAGNPSQEERDRYGRLIMLASFRLAHKAKFWYADSNPGNYLFLPDGTLGLLDFGCVREFTTDEWDFYVQVWKVYQEGGRGLREAMLRAGDFDPARPVDEDHIRFLEDYSHWWSDYMMTDELFDFGDEAFMRRGIEFITQVAERRYFRTLPVNVWITRQLLGLRALAFRLKARVNMKQLGQQESWDLGH